MKTFYRKLIYIAFLAYLAVLFYLLFFSSYRNGVRGIIDYNLIPFTTIGRYFSNYHGMSATDQLAGNILAFVPFGIFTTLLFGKWVDPLRVAALSFSLSMLAELAQFTFRVGAFDVDDLILNTLGGILGCLIAKMVSHRKRGQTLTPRG
ncbi:hypothetical protein AM500_12125 [Bacillus sp. FJAT-18017]|uniref:VanZ family protein n=1 Tax=Bacillus sp. FJAT-18017 TaxID=1705566 RepID=UPI0006AF8AC6|nr:VanZ family protein [Bacillus sp. FJAT-18017]ALC90449.1 hypothetical protein AM500_12125 [Bacillus sp. FJAT-18017]